MDMLFYLLVIGAGIAASQSGSDYDYDPDSDSAYEAPMEQPGDDDGLAEDDGFGEDGSFAEAAPEAPVAEPLPALPSFGAAPAPDPGFAAEDQTAGGRMTTATEVRPILTVTKPSWIAVREYDGQDLLYFTNLLAWRCGLHQISYAVNGGPLQVLEMEPCYVDEGAPNALKVQGVLPYVTLPLGSVQSVTVEVLYDDLGTDRSEYPRAAVQIN